MGAGRASMLGAHTLKLSNLHEHRRSGFWRGNVVMLLVVENENRAVRFQPTERIAWVRAERTVVHHEKDPCLILLPKAGTDLI